MPVLFHGGRRPWAANSERFEVKYLISEPEALAVQGFIGPFVRPDEHAFEYPVISVYLDSPGMGMFWSSDRGEKNRYKLRIRSYSESGDDPVFFEMKQRIDQVSRKYRATVGPEAVSRVLRGGLTLQSATECAADSAGVANLLRFRDFMEKTSATPKVAVRYRREAFVGRFEDRLRITLDRRLSALHCREYFPGVWRRENPWRDVGLRRVILEIKFTGSFPRWLAQMVSHFNLLRSSVSKYVVCVKNLHDGGFPTTGTGAHGRTWSSCKA